MVSLAAGREPAAAAQAGYPAGVKAWSRRGWWALGAAAGVVTLVAVAGGALQPLELSVRDALQRTLPARPVTRVAAVLVDEDALASEGRWPWPRERLAELVEAVRASGAVGIVLDVLLVEHAPGDERLAAALAAGPAVLVCAMTEDGTHWLAPPPPLAAAATLAHGLFELDADGVARRVLATKQTAGIALPAVAVAGARLASPTFAIPVGRPLVPGFRAAPRAVPRISAATLLREGAEELLAGRVAFVGVAAAGLGDSVVVPRRQGPLPDPGVLVQAAATEAVLAGDLLRPLPPLLAAAAAVLLVAAVGRAALAVGTRRLLAHGVLLVFPAVASLASLHLTGWFWPTVTLTGLVTLAVLTSELRAVLLAWRGASTSAALLRAAAGSTPPGDAKGVEGQFELLTELATAAARQRLAREESARVLAHELKTPLTSVRGLAQALRDLKLSEEDRRRAAHLLASEADRLQRMIEGLAELDRLALRPFADAATTVDLSDLLRRRLAILGRGHGRQIVPHLAEGLRVRGDAALLERVVDNLVGNAFKYSPADAPVEVTATAEGQQAVLEVSDRGSGIAPAEREAIFQRFVRGAAAAGRDGLGLGLALVREVVTWHGGRVEVAAREGGGSRFTVRLPLAEEAGERGEDPRRR